MLNAATLRRLEARPAWLFVAAWLAACLVMLGISRTMIATGMFPDADDALRLLEVRDWLAGQSWFDVTQYRINPPDGGPMHWSRLVDLPIAAVMVLLRPLLGAEGAELASLILVPLLTLGVVMFLVLRVATRLAGPRLALLAMAATPFSVGAVSQMRPMRIDHHGWQIALALVATLAALDNRPRRSGLVAGAAIALWLNISVEGLPFAVAFGALFALRWLIDPMAAERLRAFLASLAGVSALLFAATHAPSTWSAPACDAVSIAHLAAFAAAAVCCLAGARETLRSRWARLAVLAASGTLALAALAAANVQCVHDPFSTLDPVVRQFWYDRILEGLPIWRQDAISAAAYLALPLVGLAGAWLARQGASGPQRTAWENYFVLLAGATLACVLVARAGAETNTMALPGAVCLCAVAVRHARALRLTPLRVVATAAAFFTVMPASAIAIVAGWTGSDAKPRPSSGPRCLSAAEMTRLRQLPTGDIAAPLDISTTLLVHTPHRIIASGHHRNAAGMRDVIQLFILPAERARTIIARRDIEYIVVCPALREARDYAEDSPHGLWAGLAVGRSPSWLERMNVPGMTALRVWRVRKDRLTDAASPAGGAPVATRAD